MTKNAERDAKIIALATAPGGLTYVEIAAKMQISRGVVSGVMFRHNKPHDSHAGRDAVVRKIPYAGAER